MRNATGEKDSGAALTAAEQLAGHNLKLIEKTTNWSVFINGLLRLRLQIIIQSQMETPDSRFLIIPQCEPLASRFEPLLL